MLTTRKCNMLTKMVVVSREDQGGGNEGEPRGALCVTMYKSNGKTRKQTGRQKESAKQEHRNMLTKTIIIRSIRLNTYTYIPIS